jgi:hypothetical protein
LPPRVHVHDRAVASTVVKETVATIKANIARNLDMGFASSLPVGLKLTTGVVLSAKAHGPCSLIPAYSHSVASSSAAAKSVFPRFLTANTTSSRRRVSQ